MKNYKIGFTLSELLVALGVIGVLCAVLVPIIFSLRPNQNILMARRAYNIATIAITDMINDENCYPDLSRSNNSKEGFDDGSGYNNCKAWETSQEDKPHDKFKTLFKKKLDVNSENDNKITTKDGIVWKITADANAGINYIVIDVNGNKEPNCSTDCTNGDRFVIKVSSNGKMEIGAVWAQNAIKLDSDFIQDGTGFGGSDYGQSY